MPCCGVWTSTLMSSGGGGSQRDVCRRVTRFSFLKDPCRAMWRPIWRGPGRGEGGPSDSDMRGDWAAECLRTAKTEEESFRVLAGKIFRNYLSLRNLYSLMILVPETGQKYLRFIYYGFCSSQRLISEFWRENMDFSSASLSTPLEFQEMCKCQGQCPDEKGVFVEISSCSINCPN